MSLPHKPGPAQTLALIGEIPFPPKLPDTMINRFPELEAYQTAMDQWWSRFADMLQRDRESVSTQFAADQTAIQALQAKAASVS